MTRQIQNPKALQSKSKTHKVVQTGEQTFEVISGHSGTTYYVTHLHTGGMTCNCKWGQYRTSNDPRSGCSHVQAAYAFRTQRKISTWTSQEQANRQHRPVLNIGNGVYLTARV